MSVSKYRLTHWRDLLYELVARDMKLRYRRSMLGMAWSLLNPLFQLLIFTFVFRNILPLQIPNYTPFLFIGLLMWNWFQASLLGATTTIIDGGALIKRPGFPAAVLPIVTVTANLVNLLLALPILLIFLPLAGIALTATIFYLPLLIALQFIFTLSLAYLLATVHVAYRDTQHLLTVLLMFYFYLTPIFYDANSIQLPWRDLYQLNPFFHLLAAYRSILLDGAAPASAPLAIITILALGLLVVGYRFFMNSAYRFVEDL